MRLHAYAADTQLYLKCHTQEATTAAHTLEACDCVDEYEQAQISFMPIKQSFSGLGPNAVLPYLAAVARHSSSDHVRLLGVTIIFGPQP